jgi:transposase
MKNKMLKGAHLSERKCREIVNLFCEDLTATQIAAITGVSRVTINAYVKMIRTRLALFCEAAYPSQHLPGNSVSLTLVGDGLPVTSYYGFMKHDGQVYSTGLSAMNREQIMNWQRQVNGQQFAAMESIHAVADFTNWRLYRRDTLNTFPLKTGNDDISGFWGLARNRLMKFRGLNRNTLYLHIKECEFRFNHRHEDMQQKLLQLISKHPLHEMQYRA